MSDIEALKNSLLIIPPSKKLLEIRAEREAEFVAQTAAQRMRKYRARKSKAKLENIAILDMETDPFDSELQTQIEPFLAVLYADQFEPVIIWDEDRFSFARKVIAAIEALPEPYTIYAHNGGKFDYMFLMHELRGDVSFKGRGIMRAKIGPHEIRDSFHILPDRLAAFNKDVFDYKNMAKDKRNNFRKEIIDYCIADCRYLLDIVKSFVKEFGLKLSIGAAALADLRRHYKYETLTSSVDESLRPFFFGGRVECLAGRGIFTGHYKLYDVNSMYPAVMANMKHPIGNKYTWRPGEPGEMTCFIDLECKNNGALVQRQKLEDGTYETTTGVREGRFMTTIHEYKAALELGLIWDVKINMCVDNNKLTDFSKFVLPHYEKRQEIKGTLKKFKEQMLSETSQTWLDVKKDDMFRKFLLNNGYGKFAQNPRRYKETFVTNPGEAPDVEGYEDTTPVYEGAKYWIWQKPAPKQKFNNVGTAASITGAARSVLMRAIAGATDPIYCDTDSLICREISGVELDGVKLGAWDLEAEFSEVIVNGKKMYACKPLNGGKEKIRSKGVNGLTYDEMKKMFYGEILEKVNSGVTLTRTGNQYYVTRKVRATAKLRNDRNGDQFDLRDIERA